MSFLKKYSKEIDQFKNKFLGDDDKKKDQARQQESQPPYVGGSQTGAQQGGPQLPPGWIAQWDPNSQRWYYLEQASGRTQWELPGSYPPQPPSGAGMPYQGQAAQTIPGAHSGGSYTVENEGKSKKDKSHKGMIAGAVGGLAAGGLIGHAIHGDSSDEEHHHPTASTETGYYQPNPSSSGQAPAPAAAPLPDQTVDGDSVSGSDKESVEEARQEYEEAVADGDSRSDVEEAREEYQEEYEETYDD